MSKDKVSPTLAMLHHMMEFKHWALKVDGLGGIASRVNAMTFCPTDDYPAPWRLTQSPEGICTIYAANNEKVADYLNHSNAQTVLQEISGDD